MSVITDLGEDGGVSGDGGVGRFGVTGVENDCSIWLTSILLSRTKSGFSNDSMSSYLDSMENES